jgi:hypothetical protein
LGAVAWMVHFFQVIPYQRLSLTLEPTREAFTRLISNLDRTKHASEITAAILSSFPDEQNDLYLLSSDTFDIFKKLGVVFDDKIVLDTKPRLEISSKFLSNILFSEGYCGSLSLLEELVNMEEPPTQDIIDSGFIPRMVLSTMNATSLFVQDGNHDEWNFCFTSIKVTRSQQSQCNRGDYSQWVSPDTQCKPIWAYIQSQS